MKQLTVISGKGGTGKTSLTAAFANLSFPHAVFADCDVDAADLHLLLHPNIESEKKFSGMKIATIDKERCIDCKKCYESCAFEAIDRDIILHKESCEGCGVCAYLCPVDAIEMVDRDSGRIYQSNTRFGPLSHARLNTAEEASGKLVTMVREQAIALAEKNQKDLIIIDGPPGIGCPVISSISGVDLVLIVTEPTLSAIHDLKRIQSVAAHFNIPAVVCINKYSINAENTKKIESYCKTHQLEVVGKIPYDKSVTDALIEEKTIMEHDNSELKSCVQTLWNNVLRRLN